MNNRASRGDHRRRFGGLYAARGLAGGSVGIAPAAVFFAADDSKWITGETLLISGGLR